MSQIAIVNAQIAVATGIENSKQIRNVISDAGLKIDDEAAANTNASTLSGISVLALFHGGLKEVGKSFFTVNLKVIPVLLLQGLSLVAVYRALLL